MKCNRLKETIEELIHSRKEGDYWDFKREPPTKEKKVDFILDIICLANADHNGDRYLIYGVENDGSLSNEDWRSQEEYSWWKQHKITNILSDVRFSARNFPKVYLEHIEIEKKRVDVIIIKNDPKARPYYLEASYPQKKHKSREKIINARTIYSRVGDANTPKDKVAPSKDIERMWRERFDLDKTPLDRVKIYLQHNLMGEEKWVQGEQENYWHYSDFPEFTITGSIDDSKASGEDWALVGLNPRYYRKVFEIKFHQTILKEIVCITFDNYHDTVPGPLAGFNITKPMRLHAYYLTADCFRFLFLQFIKKATKNDLLHDGIKCSRMHNRVIESKNRVPILLFESEKEKTCFEEYLEENPIDIQKMRDYEIRFDDIGLRELEIEKEEHLKLPKNKIRYTYKLMDKLIQWRGLSQGSCRCKLL